MSPAETQSDPLAQNELAYREVGRLWTALARKLGKIARKMADGGTHLDARSAVSVARLAEACWWQSTGESDCVSMKEEI